MIHAVDGQHISPHTPSHASIRDALDALLEPGGVAELRILNTRRGTVSGYYNNLIKLAEDATRWSGRAPGVFMTLNPVNPALLARSANRLSEYAKHTTSDADVVRRRWLPIDLDPLRPAGVSSTDAEHEAAHWRAQDISLWLRDRGWPDPIVADSGNGAHLLYRIDLPNNAASLALVGRCLRALAFQFNDERVAVDVTTGNAARIWKVYGTLAAKGDNLPERPHRVARLLGFPS